MKALKFVASPLLALTGVLKKPKLPAPVRTPTRDDAAAEIASEDALRKRRGGAADILNSAGGVEAGSSAGGKDTLGS